MAPAGDESSMFVDSDASSGYSDTEDREALTRCKQALGLSISYVRSWKPRDAFREFFQNWTDAITERFGLFRLDITDDAGVYVAQARDPKTNDLLGFIRYKEKEGTLELTNFDAKLSRSTLDLGVTSKRGKDHLAGTHGEGFKVAALVIVREGYQARIETSSYYWRFSFGGRYKDHLYCGLTPVTAAKLDKQKQAYALKTGKPRELLNNIWEDVSVKIGRVHGPNWGQKIARRDFEQWMKVAIDLDGTAETIKTSHGSLILDERFGNKVFLKGLLLEGQSEGRKFKYGYDFRNGSVGRDRKALENHSHESTTLANIWGEAIEGKENDCLSKYVSMLRNQSDWADVAQAEKRMSGATAKAIWDHLRTEASSQHQFYHGDQNEYMDVKIIRKCLKKEPVELPDCIWNPLRKFDYIRTPEEERYDLLRKAPVAVEKNTPYAFMVKRALLATLCLDMRTENLELVIKDGTVAELDLLLDGNQLMVNEKWLDFYTSHNNVPCWLSRLSATKGFVSDTFSCDHIITDLYDMVLKEINNHQEGEAHIDVEPDGLLRLRLVENLRQMPRVIETTSGYNPGEIDVNWMNFEGDLAAKLHGIDVKYRVTLHRERTCASKRSDLVTSNDVSGDEDSFSVGSSYTAECGCPEQLVSQKDSKTTFRSLDYDEKYFPMISRTHAQAFYGVRLSPKGIRPKAPRMSGNASTHTGIANSSKQEIPNAFDNLYDASSSGEIGESSISDDEIFIPDEAGDDTSIPDDLPDAYIPDETDDSPGLQSMPPSTVGDVPIRRRRSGSPPARLDVNDTRHLDRIRVLQGQVERATREMQDSEANIVILQNRLEEAAAIQRKADKEILDLNSEKDVLEGKLRSIASLEKDKKDLHTQILHKVKAMQEAQAVEPPQNELVTRNATVEHLHKEIIELETTLHHKDPINYEIFGRVRQQRLDVFKTSLEHQRRISKGIEAENITKRKMLEEKEQLLQTRDTELDAARNALGEKEKLLQTRDTELDAARNALREKDVKLTNAREKNEVLKGALKQAEVELSEKDAELSRSDLVVSHVANRLASMGKASNSAARINGPGSGEIRIKEEEERPASSSERGRKRARTGLHDSQYRNVADDPIVID